VRGVPLGPDQYFFEPLWTNFRVAMNNGILDWYTGLTGIIALVTLTAHGAIYIATKSNGDLNRRTQATATRLWALQVILTSAGVLATIWIRPALLDNYKRYAIGFLIPAIVYGALAIMIVALRKRQEKTAFIASSCYIVGMLAGAAYGLYPVVLPATTDPARSLTIYNSAAGHHGLSVGLVWWFFGMTLTLVYFFFVYRMFRGKVRLEGEGY
jgi:cytochrome bd ubiquinol oxidase subunit II